MLPPTVTLEPGGLEHPARQRRRRRLPFRAGDRDRRGRAATATPARSPPMTGTPRSRGFWIDGLIGRHARAEHDEVRVGQRLAAVAAELELHAQTAQRFGLRHLGAHLGQRDPGAAARQQLGGGNAASRRPDDGHAFPHSNPRPSFAHRSFNVVRLNNANMIPTITKRVMTFGSLHPISSKWWWSGAIRNTRCAGHLERRRPA